MNRSARRRAAQALQGSIRRILSRHWDPIEVGDRPETHDEYDRYVGGVYRLLAAGASANQIAEHLRRIETEEMGLPRRELEAVLPAAARLSEVAARAKMAHFDRQGAE